MSIKTFFSFFLVYFPSRVPSLRRSILEHSNTSINSGAVAHITSASHQREFGAGGNFQDSIDYNVSNMEIAGLSRTQRRPFLRGSTMSMVAKPEATSGFVTNNLGYYNNNYSDAISVKSVQIGGGGRTRNSLNKMKRQQSSCGYNNVHIICRDDDRDPLLSSLMSSPSKRSLSTKSLLSTTTKSAKGYGTIDPQSLPQTTIFMQHEESGLTKEEIAG